MRASIDIETYENGKPVLDARKFYYGILYTENHEYYEAKEPEELWKAVMDLAKKCAKRKEKLYLYAHHHSYDFCGYAQNHLFDVIHVCWEPFLAIKDNIYFCDTMSFFPKSLEELGKDLRIPKMEMPEKIEKPEDLFDYCLQDCRITLSAILYLEDTLDTIGMRPSKMITAGQVAMTSWQTYIRKRNLHYGVMKKGKVYRNDNWKETRYAYRGARCQAFKRGEFEEAYMLDVKSMYPHIMSTMRFPDLATAYFIVSPEKEDWTTILDCIGVMRTTIKCPEKGIGYLPIWFEGHQEYPTNGETIKGTWTIGEIRKATQEGYTIEEIDWAECYFDNEINPFTEYMKSLYKMKEEGEPIKKIAVKLLMNNLYGKFAQHKITRKLELVERADYEPEMGKRIGEYGTKYVIETGTEEMIRDFTNPIITALITAGARTKLYDTMKKIPEKDLLYCDTDAIIFKGKENIKQFKIGKELGEWEIKKERKMQNKKRKSIRLRR